MKKAFLFLLSFFISVGAYANMSLFPHTVFFDASKNQKVHSVRVINTTKETQTYRVSMVNMIQKNTGELSETTEKRPYFASDYFTFAPRQFTLKAGEMQTVNVGRKSLYNVPDGEYVSHLKISETQLGAQKTKAPAEADNKTFSVELKMLFAVTIPVTLTKGDNLTYHVTYNTHQYDAAKNALSVSFSRTGNRSARFDIKMTDASGQQVGILKNIKIYLSADKTTISINPTRPLTTGETLTLTVTDALDNNQLFVKDITI